MKYKHKEFPSDVMILLYVLKAKIWLGMLVFFLTVPYNRLKCTKNDIRAILYTFLYFVRFLCDCDNNYNSGPEYSYSDLSGCWVLTEIRIPLKLVLGRENCCTFHKFSSTDSIKPSMLFF